MSSAQGNESALGQLQLAEQAELLDAIDQLRSEAFQHELTLPQLIVCGDQSSGKSSVLEAISRVRFPARGTFCTEFATELKLRRAPSGTKTSILVSIQPAESRLEDQKKLLREFRPAEQPSGLEDLPKIIAQVGKLLRTLSTKRSIYEDKLLVTVYGTDLPNLTLVDLPGIFHASNDNKAQDDIPRVKQLVQSYMQNENSIILAVLPAINDFDNQAVLEMAKSIDKSGRRTLGIITKPDKLDPGDILEHTVIQYARNLKLNLELGWHVLRNRSSGQEDVTADERDSLEVQFFAQGSTVGWRTIPNEDRGADNLRTKLANILLSAISKSLPSLVREIHSGISTYEKDLERLGEPKTTDGEKTEELREISLRLNKLVESGVGGNYSSSSFFDHTVKDKRATRRLRASLRDILDSFARHMREKGRLYIAETIAPSSSTATSSVWNLPSAHERINIVSGPESVRMDALLDAISLKIKESRGCELDGLIPPPVIAKIFHALSSKWDCIAACYIEHCRQAVKNFFIEAIHQSAPTHIANRVIGDIASERFERMRDQLLLKRTELLKPYRSTYLVTTRNMELAAKEGETPTSTAAQVYKYVESYYEIALATFTENIAAIAVENCLVDELNAVFTFKTIAKMSSEDVDALTQEPKNIARARERYQERLKTLRNVLRVCMKHVDSVDIPYESTLFASEIPSETTKENIIPTICSPAKSAPQMSETVAQPCDMEKPAIIGYPSPPKTPSLSSANVTPKPVRRSGSVRPYRKSARSSQVLEKVLADYHEAKPIFSPQPVLRTTAPIYNFAAPDDAEASDESL